MTAAADRDAPPAAVPGRRRVAIIGAGGVGGYFAGLLAAAGHDVRLLARGAHLAAIRAHGGLEVRELGGRRFTVDVGATDDPSALAPADYAVVAVKCYSLADVAPSVRVLAESGAAVIPLLNGVGIDDWLATLGVPRASIIPGLTYVSAARTAPGVVERFSAFCRVVVGAPAGAEGLVERATDFVRILRGAGAEARVTDAIESELWRKFAFIASMAAVCGVARQPTGVVRDAPFGRDVIARAIREVVAVGRASGVSLADEVVTDTLRTIDGLAFDARPSFLLDIERGGPTELDALSGAIARRGRAVGVETPLHDMAVVALTPPPR